MMGRLDERAIRQFVKLKITKRKPPLESGSFIRKSMIDNSGSKQ